MGLLEYFVDVVDEGVYCFCYCRCPLMDGEGGLKPPVFLRLRLQIVYCCVYQFRHSPLELKEGSHHPGSPSFY
jgi:hypothetical protein